MDNKDEETVSSTSSSVTLIKEKTLKENQQKDELIRSMTFQEFYEVVENSLCFDEAEKDDEVVPGIKVIFRRSAASLFSSFTKMDEQVFKLQRGLRGLFIVRCSDRVLNSQQLRDLFDFTKGSFYSNINDEVTRTMSMMLPPEMNGDLRMRTTGRLTSSIYDDVLNLMIIELDYQTKYSADSVLVEVDVAQNLLLKTAKKMQDFLQICTVCDWLRASRGSPVNIHDELDVMVPRLSKKVAEAIFQAMLNVSFAGTSKDFIDCGSDTPLRNFFHAVADKIKPKVSPEAGELKSACSNVADEHPSALKQADSTKKEEHHTANYSVVTVKPWSSECPRSERVLESIIFNVSGDNDIDTTERDAQAFFGFSIKDFLVEVCQKVSHIIMNETSEVAMTPGAAKSQRTHSESVEPPVFDSELESCVATAASGAVNALLSELKSTFEEDFKLADPSVDPVLYNTQVQMVCEKVLKSIQPKMKEILVTDIFIRSNRAMAAKDEARQKQDLLLGSGQILHTIIKNITVILKKHRTGLSATLDEMFHWYKWLESLDENLLFARHCIQSGCEKSQEEDVNIKRRRSFQIRLPKIKKLRFKKNRIEPATVHQQHQPLPAAPSVSAPLDESSNSQASSTSTTKRKSFFSRVFTAVSKAFRKTSKTSPSSASDSSKKLIH